MYIWNYLVFGQMQKGTGFRQVRHFNSVVEHEKYIN